MTKEKEHHSTFKAQGQQSGMMVEMRSESRTQQQIQLAPSAMKRPTASIHPNDKKAGPTIIVNRRTYAFSKYRIRDREAFREIVEGFYLRTIPSGVTPQERMTRTSQDTGVSLQERLLGTSHYSEVTTSQKQHIRTSLDPVPTLRERLIGTQHDQVATKSQETCRDSDIGRSLPTTPQSLSPKKTSIRTKAETLTPALQISTILEQDIGMALHSSSSSPFSDPRSANSKSFPFEAMMEELSFTMEQTNDITPEMVLEDLDRTEKKAEQISMKASNFRNNIVSQRATFPEAKISASPGTTRITASSVPTLHEMLFGKESPVVESQASDKRPSQPGVIVPLGIREPHASENLERKIEPEAASTIQKRRKKKDEVTDDAKKGATAGMGPVETERISSHVPTTGTGISMTRSPLAAIPRPFPPRAPYVVPLQTTTMPAPIVSNTHSFPQRPPVHPMQTTTMPATIVSNPHSFPQRPRVHPMQTTSMPTPMPAPLVTSPHSFPQGPHVHPIQTTSMPTPMIINPRPFIQGPHVRTTSSMIPMGVNPAPQTLITPTTPAVMMPTPVATNLPRTPVAGPNATTPAFTPNPPRATTSGGASLVHTPPYVHYAPLANPVAAPYPTPPNATHDDTAGSTWPSCPPQRPSDRPPHWGALSVTDVDTIANRQRSPKE